MRRGAVAALAALVLTGALLEVGTWAAVRSGLLHSARPHHGNTGIWWGDHPQLGVWHRPGTRGRMGGACYAAVYRINSAGARDPERARSATGPRVAVMGDSFLEGWGVPENDRVSNLLQRETGVPHLNFAMAHFGPYQQLLAWREIASAYDHDAVLASVVPTNDIADTDLDLARRITGYEFAYRPYLVEGTEGWEHRDHREPRLRRWLRLHTYSFGVFQVASRALFPDAGLGLEAPAGNRPFSFFYESKEQQIALLEEILRRFAREAAPRPLAVVLIPVQADLARYAIDGPSPLEARLRAAAVRDGWHLVDLMPAMAARTRRPAEYFFRCDYHWNRKGNQVAAELVRESLAGVFYGPSDSD